MVSPFCRSGSGGVWRAYEPLVFVARAVMKGDRMITCPDKDAILRLFKITGSDKVQARSLGRESCVLAQRFVSRSDAHRRPVFDHGVG
jgi:hypothetical protein